MAKRRVSHSARMRQFREFLFKECGGKCLYCGDPMVQPTKLQANGQIKIHKNTATFDHIVPRSKGGGRYRKDNLVLCCYDCNQQKDSMSLVVMLRIKLSGRNPKKVAQELRNERSASRRAQVPVFDWERATKEREYQEQLREFFTSRAI